MDSVTYYFLEDKRKVLKIVDHIMACQNGDGTFDTTEYQPETLQKYVDEFTDLCCECLKGIVNPNFNQYKPEEGEEEDPYAKENSISEESEVDEEAMQNERAEWMEHLLCLLESVFQSNFGELLFPVFKKKVNLFNSSCMEKLEKKTKGIGKNKIPFPYEEGIKLSNFWNVPPAQNDSVDVLFKCQQGNEVVTPSQVKVTAGIHKYAATLEKTFIEDIQSILTSNKGKHFKGNLKKLARIKQKMNANIKENKSPPYDFLFDLLRCKAEFDNQKALLKAYKALEAKYKILRVKNKLDSSLGNLHINLVYVDLIVEVQLELKGAVEENWTIHKVYEVARCENINDAYEVVRDWHEEDRDPELKFQNYIKPLKKIPMDEWSLPGKFNVYRTKEWGIVDFEDRFWDELKSARLPLFQTLIAEHDSKNIYGLALTGNFIECSDLPTPSSYEVLEKKMKVGNYICQVS